MSTFRKLITNILTDEEIRGFNIACYTNKLYRVYSEEIICCDIIDENYLEVIKEIVNYFELKLKYESLSDNKILISINGIKK